MALEPLPMAPFTGSGGGGGAGQRVRNQTRQIFGEAAGKRQVQVFLPAQPESPQKALRGVGRGDRDLNMVLVCFLFLFFFNPTPNMFVPLP